jgi:hypothetical protein
VAASVAALVLAGCSSSEPAPAPATTATSAAFDPPPGVTITPGGTRLAVGKPATVVYRVADGAASAITVTVSKVTPGSMDDFAFFSLDAATKKSSPYYVRVSVTNNGPAGLGGVSVPLFALDSTNTNVPANDIIGTFKPCPTPTLPASFLPGATADLCRVYLLPEGRTLRSISLQTGATKDAIRWKP